MHPYDLLNEDENKIIQKTRELRVQMIDEFINEKGVPTSTRDMRVLNEVMNSLDAQVLGLVDRKLKQEENKTNNDIKDKVIEAIKIIQTSHSQESNKQVDLSDKFVPVDIVPGETKIEYEQIELDDIIKDEK